MSEIDKGIYTRYIRFSTEDKLGNDINNTLSNTTSITIPWSNGTKTQYNVLGASVGDGYYNFLID